LMAFLLCQRSSRISLLIHSLEFSFSYYSCIACYFDTNFLSLNQISY
jgi:hypothetical protein